jgi:hypothetical protein
MDYGVYYIHLTHRIQWGESADNVKHPDIVDTKALNSRAFRYHEYESA